MSDEQRGYVSIPRALWNDPTFADEPFSEREAWAWMIADASWRPRERRVGRLTAWTERGELAASVRFLAEAFTWSKSRAHRFLKRLEKRERIAIRTSNEGGTGVIVVTICNYDQFQFGWDSGGTDAGQSRDRSGTNENKLKNIKTNIPDEGDDPRPSTVHVDETAEAVRAYNDAALIGGWPKVQKITTARRAALNARLRDADGIDGWRSALDRALASDFLCGRVVTTRGDPFFASFDFLTRQSSFVKLMEGQYDNREPSHDASRPHQPHRGQAHGRGRASTRRSGHQIANEIDGALGIGQSQAFSGWDA